MFLGTFFKCPTTFPEFFPDLITYPLVPLPLASTELNFGTLIDLA
jgi:hypothetical protein